MTFCLSLSIPRKEETPPQPKCFRNEVTKHNNALYVGSLLASIRILIRSIFCEKGKTTKTRLECKKPLLACQCKATFSPNAFFHVHFKELSNDKT